MNAPWCWRVVAGVAIVDLLGLALELGAAASVPAHPDAPAWLLAIAGAPAWLLAAIGVVAALRWLARPRATAAIAALWLVLALLVEAAAAHGPGPWRARFFIGAVLLGVMAARGWSHRAGVRDDGLARTGALACLGGCYVAAATSKLGGAGPGWIDGDTLRAVALSHAHVDGAALTDWLAHAPAAARALAGATVIVQLGGGLGLLVAGRTRVIAAASLVAFHLGVAAFTRIGYWQPVALLLALAGPWSRADAAPQPQHAARADRAVLLAIAVAIAIAWLSPLRRYAAAHHRTRLLDAGESVAREPRASLGPLVRGEAIADGWAVDALACESDRAMIVLRHAAHGRAVLWLTAPGSGPRSPFDRAHLQLGYEATAAAASLRFAAAAVVVADRLEAAATTGTAMPPCG